MPFGRDSEKKIDEAHLKSALANLAGDFPITNCDLDDIVMTTRLAFDFFDLRLAIRAVAISATHVVSLSFRRPDVPRPTFLAKL